MKRKTTKHRRPTRQSVLEVRVMSPRIAWFGFLKLAGKFTKLACVLAALTGIGWGVWRGIQHAFYQNPDFRLQVLDLNANPVIDELGVAAAAGIDLTANPSLFDVDVKEAERKLNKLPEITNARVERHLPGTLVVRVIPRSPKAWISSPAAGHPDVRRAGAMLVDHDGIAYPCPERQLETASALPIIELPPSADHPIQAGSKIQQPELEYCFLLLDSARQADPDAIQWIELIRPVNDWSLQLVTRQGTSAIFGLGDHERQIESLRAALDHAGEKGYVIDTINLIPKYNIPITLRSEAAPPKAIPVSAPDPADERKNRRTRDLSNLLHRN
jgi:hypothetical protein